MEGFVIVNKKFRTFYNGYANFVKDLRDVKIYHTEKGANDTMNLLVKKGRVVEDLAIKPIKIELMEDF